MINSHATKLSEISDVSTLKLSTPYSYVTIDCVGTHEHRVQQYSFRTEQLGAHTVACWRVPEILSDSLTIGGCFDLDSRIRNQLIQSGSYHCARCGGQATLSPWQEQLSLNGVQGGVVALLVAYDAVPAGMNIEYEIVNDQLVEAHLPPADTIDSSRLAVVATVALPISPDEHDRFAQQITAFPTGGALALIDRKARKAQIIGEAPAVVRCHRCEVSTRAFKTVSGDALSDPALFTKQLAGLSFDALLAIPIEELVRLPVFTTQTNSLAKDLQDLAATDLAGCTLTTTVASLSAASRLQLGGLQLERNALSGSIVLAEDFSPYCDSENVKTLSQIAARLVARDMRMIALTAGIEVKPRPKELSSPFSLVLRDQQAQQFVEAPLIAALGFYDELMEELCATFEARVSGVTAESLKLFSGAHLCPECRGAGFITATATQLSVCSGCDASRFDEVVRAITTHGVSGATIMHRQLANLPSEIFLSASSAALWDFAAKLGLGAYPLGTPYVELFVWQKWIVRTVREIKSALGKRGGLTATEWHWEPEGRALPSLRSVLQELAVWMRSQGATVTLDETRGE